MNELTRKLRQMRTQLRASELGQMPQTSYSDVSTAQKCGLSLLLISESYIKSTRELITRSSRSEIAEDKGQAASRKARADHAGNYGVGQART